MTFSESCRLCGSSGMETWLERASDYITGATFSVKDLAKEMEDLREKGVRFEEYDLPGIKTVDGVATMGEHKGAWFKDPSGNILALHQGA